MVIQLGEVKRGIEVGRKGTNYWMWCACPKCGKQRWVYLKHGKPVSKHCVQCREYVLTPARARVHELRKGITDGKSELIKSLIYLWTRDAQFPVNKETEDYITDHLRKIRQAKKAIFSDKTRIDMVTGILK